MSRAPWNIVLHPAAETAGLPLATALAAVRGRRMQYGVRELYEKLKSEIDLRIGGQVRNAATWRFARQPVVIAATCIIATALLIIGIAFIALRNTPHRGYYRYQDDNYYYQSGDWYFYDGYNTTWYPAYTVPYELEEDYRNYYSGSDYDDWYGVQDFEDTDYYDDYDWDSSSSSSSWDSWDSFDTDWDSDW